MHGVKKVKTSEDKEQERKAENRKKIAEYRAHLSGVVRLAQEGRYGDPEGLRATAAALAVGPDSNLLWNYRKRALLAMPSTEGGQLTDAGAVKEELALLERCIQANPKSYWMWYHRRWVGERYADMNWRRELGLCDKLLELDSRNFHCWNYRRFVASTKLGSSDAAELAFSDTKIRQNFSNYSAWHQRSYLLLRMFAGPELLERIRTTELAYIRNALYVEPADQSGWIYHNWLVGNALRLIPADATAERAAFLNSELAECRKLLELEPDSKWTLLACTRLLLALGDTSSVAEACTLLDRLRIIDPAHAAFYNHLQQQQQH